ncbi:MAG: hypothetical protein EA424_27840 [Planctomycetaceae bacterium]|nr:MAG: hypothetical protein EA424_27840 [Planctomycetaceae bacterium]
MERRINEIPFEALITTENDLVNGLVADPRQLLDSADVVYAVNGRDDRDILIYGKDKLRRIAESDVPEGARVVRVRIRTGQNELESLLELVRQTKGYHDYAESA